jgi:hypothetical protein
MGRTAAVLMADGGLERTAFRGSDALYEIVRRACRQTRSERFDSTTAFCVAWQEARRVG